MKYSSDCEPLKVLSHLEFVFFGLSYGGKVYVIVTIRGNLGLVNESHMDSQVRRVLRILVMNLFFLKANLTTAHVALAKH